VACSTEFLRPGNVAVFDNDSVSYALDLENHRNIQTLIVLSLLEDDDIK